jgi:hypothetical protein
MPQVSLRRALGPATVGVLAMLAIALTGVPSASAAQRAPSLAAPGEAHSRATAIVPDNFPTAYNQRTLWLVSNPLLGMADACTKRTIYLARGIYTWTYLWDGNAVSTGNTGIFSITAAGNYIWEDCLYPEQGYYIQNSSLMATFSGAGFGTLGLPDVEEVAFEDAYYTFGSSLAPQF